MMQTRARSTAHSTAEQSTAEHSTAAQYRGTYLVLHLHLQCQHFRGVLGGDQVVHAQVRQVLLQLLQSPTRVVPARRNKQYATSGQMRSE